jgi:hypothetical protein
MTVKASAFPGFNLLQCESCEQPIKLIPTTGPRPAGMRPTRKKDLNRIMRSARRMQAKNAKRMT